MKTLPNFDLRQKFAHFGIQTTGHVIAVGVVIFLVLAWVLTSPFIQLADQIAGNEKLKKEKL
jgi:hypothetical protein